MVRLKAPAAASMRSSSDVSIPYGTIKSHFFRVLASFNFVSIPYGTIKSLQPLRQRVPEDVSIPYGTIKRPKEMTDERRNVGFQFHMVRLKVRGVRVDAGRPRFQFHMVRLKDGELLVPYRAETVFQFHMVRLKARIWHNTYYCRLNIYKNKDKKIAEIFMSTGNSIKIVEIRQLIITLNSNMSKNKSYYRACFVSIKYSRRQHHSLYNHKKLSIDERLFPKIRFSNDTCECPLNIITLSSLLSINLSQCIISSFKRASEISPSKTEF